MALNARPPEVQKGVDDYLELHKEELKAVYALPPEEREQEFTRLLDKELNYIAIMGYHNPKRELTTRIMIAMETDRLMELDSGLQQKVIFEKYGLDPISVINNYPELQSKASHLQKTLESVDRKNTLLGWVTMAASMAAFLIPFGKGKRSLGDRIANDNKLLKWFVASLSSIAAAFGVTIAASHMMGDVKDQSKTLVSQARTALEREVNDAVDYKIRNAVQVASAANEVSGVNRNVDDEGFQRSGVQPRASYVAENMKEKMAGQGMANAVS